jgi:hypothetical protein
VSGGQVVTRNVPEMVLVELELRIKWLETSVKAGRKKSESG